MGVNSSERSSLTHYGIPGMKWGVRRSPDQLRKAAKKRGDSRDWDTARNEAKGMSDSELKSRVSRLQLEKQYADLSTQSNRQKVSSGNKWVDNHLVQEGAKIINNATRQYATSRLTREFQKHLG